jgi:hypothetical protein
MSDHDHHHHSHDGEVHPHQLEPPHAVFHDAKAVEVARAWICDGRLSVALHAMAFGKPEVWGHLLAGIAQQVASACEELGHGDAAGNFTAIRDTLIADLDTLAKGLARA